MDFPYRSRMLKVSSLKCGQPLSKVEKFYCMVLVCVCGCVCACVRVCVHACVCVGVGGCGWE